VLWCRLPRPASSALAQAAQAQGVRVSPGPRFAADGTLESWVRLPFTRPAAELELALPALARAWEAVARAPRGARTGREQEFVV
jgi:DNA-binding transcriptional MocR family regulator